VFDFTIGDEGFKTQWCEESFPLADGATAVSVVGLPLAASLRSFKTARRLIKSRPAMLAAANMVRRLAKA
jgi:CelD/BcsL family acetyltransferase involved in cellulose biosynthesis